MHGTQPNSQVALFLAANPNFQPVDLTIAGVDGCTLYVDPLLCPVIRSGAGDAQRAEGVAIAALPVPNDASLRGGVFEVQAAVLDASTPRPLKLTMTNALSITVQ